MLKFIFNLLVSPLGLPINALYEYLILLIVGEFAYLSAYRIVGNLIGDGLIPDRKTASVAHWIFRFAVYFVAWAILRVAIGLFI